MPILLKCFLSKLVYFNIIKNSKHYISKNDIQKMVERFDVNIP